MAMSSIMVKSADSSSAEIGSRAKKGKSSRRILTNTVQDYAAVSTTHGINYVCDPTLLFIERFLWFAACCFFLSLSVLWTVEAYNKWQNYPVITSVRTTGLYYTSWFTIKNIRFDFDSSSATPDTNI